MVKSIEALKNEFLEGKNLKFDCLKNLGADGRLRFIKALEARASDPSKIQQGNAYLCGPAAFLHCIATRRLGFDDYMRYVLELATSGVGKLGNLTVEPSKRCRNASLGTEIEPVDWIPLASLRDASNRFRSMGGPHHGIADVTLGSAICDWFSATGWYSSVVNRSWGGAPESLCHLLDINSRHNSDTCLLVKASIISGRATKVGPKKPGRAWQTIG